MKIVMTFDREDLKELISDHLRRKGLDVATADMKFTGTAKVTVEVDGKTVEAAPDTPATPAVTPRRDAVEDPPMDLDDIKAASAAITNKKPGMYPVEHTKLDGEMSEEEAAAFFKQTPRGR